MTRDLWTLKCGVIANNIGPLAQAGVDTAMKANVWMQRTSRHWFRSSGVNHLRVVNGSEFILKPFLITVMFLTLFGCASPQDISILDSRLSTIEHGSRELRERNLVLEKEVAQLHAQTEENEKDRGEREQLLRNQVAGLHAALEELSDRVQLLYGKAEELDYALREKTGESVDQEQLRDEKLHRIEATANLNSDRVAHIEHYLGFETSVNLDLPATSDGLEGKALSDKELYVIAKQSFDRGDYEAARQGFQRILEQFPQSDNADNSQFWIGETYYREKWYEKAILEYQKVIETYPRGNKVPASFLKQGLAFLNLRDKANSRLILEELTKKFPKSSESSIAKQKLLELK